MIKNSKSRTEIAVEATIKTLKESLEHMDRHIDDLKIQRDRLRKLLLDLQNESR